MDESKKDIRRYLDGIGAQHRSRPKFMGFTTALLEKVDASHAVAKDIPAAFHVHEAVGAQLDVIGQLVGADRRVPIVSIPDQPVWLDDDSYRKMILARIIQNQWDGSYENFREIWDTTLGSMLDATYRDNQDMTMDISILGMLSPTLKELIFRGYFLPKPMGVSIHTTIASETEMAHSFFAAGFFGQGYMQTDLPLIDLDAGGFAPHPLFASGFMQSGYMETTLPEIEFAKCIGSLHAGTTMVSTTHTVLPEVLPEMEAMQ